MKFYAILRNFTQFYAIPQKLTFSITKTYTAIWQYTVSFINAIQVHKMCKTVQNINI